MQYVDGGGGGHNDGRPTIKMGIFLKKRGGQDRPIDV